MLLFEFTEILTERAHDVLFHVTKLPETVEILKNEEFHLGFSLAKDYAEPFRPKGSDKYFYLSTARSPTSGFISIRRNSGNAQVLFEFNGDWFNTHGYVVKPVDYFNGGSGAQDEMEDRVFSKKPELSFKGDATGLIKALHIKVPGSFVGEIAKDLLPVLKECKRLNIPFYVYTDGNAWLGRRTNKALSQSQVIEALKIELSSSRKYDKNSSVFKGKRNQSGAKIYNAKYTGKPAYNALINLITAKSPEDITEDTFHIIDGIIQYIGDEESGIKQMFFLSKYHLGPKAASNLVAAIKKSGMNTDKIWQKLAEKWMGLTYNLKFSKTPKAKPHYNPNSEPTNINDELDTPF